VATLDALGPAVSLDAQAAVTGARLSVVGLGLARVLLFREGLTRWL
jgi:hypothetical protein